MQERSDPLRYTPPPNMQKARKDDSLPAYCQTPNMRHCGVNIEVLIQIDIRNHIV
jgi:hypothetical protein